METIKDLQYFITATSNVAGAELYVGTELKGYTPTRLSTSLLAVRDSGGVMAISAVKNGYISDTTYQLVFERNPEYLFDGDTTDLNRDNTTPTIFESSSEYILSIRKYVNGVSVLVSQNYSSTAITLDFNLIFIEDTIVNNIDEDTVTSTETVNVILNGVLGSAKFIVNGESELPITQNAGIYTFNLGDKIEIVSSDITKYRIFEIYAKGIGIDKTEQSQTTLESIRTIFTMEIPLRIIINVEELFPVEFQLPSISLLNPTEDRIYNINTNVPYPIGIIKNNKVDSLRVVVGDNELTYSNLGTDSTFVILIPESNFNIVGVYKIKLIPRNESGDGEVVNVTLNVTDAVWVGVPDIRNITYPSSIIGADYVGTDVDFELSWESINTDWVRISKPNATSFIKAPSTGNIILNVQELLNLDGVPFTQNETDINLLITLTPYNESGREVITGRVELLQIKFSKGKLTIPRNVAVNRLVDGFLSQFDSKLLQTDASKYLTHALHLGEGDNKVITTWTGSFDTLILKLYEPLPTSIQPNQQVWISKYQSNPIIETVTISGLDGVYCSPLKGPNFAIEPDNGIGFSVYDELIGNGGETSTGLINKYVSKFGIDTTKLNIQYTNDSDYIFTNFVNFSSAEERVNNFYYKMQLLDEYVLKLQKLIDLDSNLYLHTNGSTLILEQLGTYTLFNISELPFRTISDEIEANKILNSISSIVSNFDGFESYLYHTPNPSQLVYPKTEIVWNNGVKTYIIDKSTTNDVINWYTFIVNKASEFDKENPNYIVNNIPSFISNDYNNNDFILFFDMIGTHFDSIWVHINGLVNMKTTNESATSGIPKDFVINLLKSFGWNVERAFDSQFLWEYSFGMNKDGSPKYQTSLEDANTQVWRRILNNLPYLLKHKGTSRSMKAIMACYGVPQSMLTIMEFGGPQDPTTSGVSKFTFDDRTAAIKLKAGSSITVPFNVIPSSARKPQSIELMIKPDSITTDVNIVTAPNFAIVIDRIDARFVQLRMEVGANEQTSSMFELSTDRYSSILVNKTNLNPTNAQYDFYLKTSNGEDVTVSVSASFVSTVSTWENINSISFGNNFNGNIDELRFWKIPLEERKFENHTLFPDSINGNSVSSSTVDLVFRLDFERPKDRVLDPLIQNVAINRTYGAEFATATNFYTATEYPYQYEPYDRVVTADIPSTGFNYSNKIRFEDQELIGDLSYNHRATKKAFDRSAVDSNRLGIFFSPMKELNMDIIKSFGDFNIDNYIGNPSDDYKYSYTELDKLREYYFERIDLNITEYIQLVKYINKSLFDVLEDLAPLRANVSKGLLIESHFLERNKVKWDKPTAESVKYEVGIDIDESNNINSYYEKLEGIIFENDNSEFVGEYKTYLTEIREDREIQLIGVTDEYNSTITYNSDEFMEADIPTYTASIQYELPVNLLSELDAFGKSEVIGLGSNSIGNFGFGVYATDTTTILTSYDINGNVTQSRENIYLLESTRVVDVLTQTEGYPVFGALPGEQIKYEYVPTEIKEYTVTNLTFPATASLSGNVTKVIPLVGYFPTHYKFTNNLSEGLQRSYFKGSVQTINSTPDGLPSVETFTTNPNILRVADTGRGSGEPILIVK
jgi:hypothetical protein